MPFPAFRDHIQSKYCPENYRRLIVGCQKGNNIWETTENWQRRVLKKLVKQRNGTVSNTGRILSQKERPVNIWHKKGWFLAKAEGLESLLTPPPPLSISALFYGYFKKLLQATWKRTNWKEKFEVTSGDRIGTYCAKGCTVTNCDNPSS